VEDNLRGTDWGICASNIIEQAEIIGMFWPRMVSDAVEMRFFWLESRIATDLRRMIS